MGDETPADTPLAFSLDSLTLGELEELEDRLGMGLEEITEAIGSGAGRSTKLLRALVWLTRRREDPSFTWEQAGEIRVVEVAAPRPQGAGAGA